MNDESLIVQGCKNRNKKGRDWHNITTKSGWFKKNVCL